MKKRFVLVVIVSLILILSLSFVSAFSFSDWLRGLFGKPQASPDEGLIAYWTFENNVLDSVGSNHGTNNGGTFSAGKIGQALSLDGNDYVDFDKGAAILGQGAFTIAAWIKTLNTGGVIIQQRNGGYNGEYVLMVSREGKLRWFSYGDSAYGFYFNSIKTLNDGNWHHIIGMRESDGTGKIYIDGILDSSQKALPRTLVSLNVYVGADMRDKVSYFKGSIDELKIYNKALSDEEIRQEHLSSFCGDDICNESIGENSYNCPQDCLPTPTECSDSDGGKDYYMKGNCTDVGGYAPDICLPDSQNPSVIRLNEKYCNNNTRCANEIYTCPYGCKDGACILANVTNQTITCYSDDDCISTQQIWCNDLSQACEKVPMCLNPGTFNSSCSSKDVCVDCSYGCANGACVKVDESCKIEVDGLSYKVELIAATDSSATIRVTNSSGASDMKEILEGAHKIVLNQNIAVNSADESTATDSLSAELLVNGLYKLFLKTGYVCEIEKITQETCQDLISKVKNPSDFTDYDIEYRLSWNNTWESSWWVNGKEESMDEYSASWYTYYEDKWNNINYNIIVFDNRDINLESWLKDRTSYDVCKAATYWSADNKENKVYVCNWDVLRNEQNLDNYQYKSRQVLWTKDNVIVQIYTYSGKSLSDEEVIKIGQKRINQFLNDLQDNRYKYVDWENFNIDWPLSRQIEVSLAKCPSEISLETCEACWECKIEPVVCPPHGEQKRICREYCCDLPKREEIQYCSPGICSGCYVPRWSRSRDNICIPYGTRLIFEEGDDFRVYEYEMNSEVDEFRTTINNDRTALI